MVLQDAIYAILTTFGEKDSSSRWKWQCRGRKKTVLKKQEIFIGNTEKTTCKMDAKGV
ncbi:MAG: hypothetical protein ACLSVF_11160 [Faecalibacterium sp.]|uniref:Uncharacterized protein n=1 Tax=Faecalibacterium butyricigenerans TaxID=1851427 RepID=A0ABS8FA16_9FIRM|nr:hypothetical protein [Faecalibacterium sp. CLA-AA-H233]MBS7105675.1 hypothetical protein [Faecalibacterium prausnitzii]MCC2200074.1 hypothetical protein [Faecalibacterium sp. CLA-AA-H233]